MGDDESFVESGGGGGCNDGGSDGVHNLCWAPEFGSGSDTESMGVGLNDV